MEYKTEGKKIIQYDEYDSFEIASCDSPDLAIKLLIKANNLNTNRKYTTSARVFYQIEQIPGFV